MQRFWVRDEATGRILTIPLAQGRLDVEGIADTLRADSVSSLTFGNGAALRAAADGNSVLPWTVVRQTLGLPAGTTREEPLPVSVKRKRPRDRGWVYGMGSKPELVPLPPGATVFFRDEDGCSRDVLAEKIAQDGKINLGNVAGKLNRKAEEVLVGGWPVQVDEGGFTVATWSHIAGSLHGVDGSSAENPVLLRLLFKRGWLEVSGTGGCAVFEHPAVLENEILQSHARSFTDLAMRCPKRVVRVRDGNALLGSVAREVWHVDVPDGAPFVFSSAPSLNAAVRDLLDRAAEDPHGVVLGIAHRRGRDKAIPVVAFVSSCGPSRFLRGEVFKFDMGKVVVTKELMFQVFAAVRMFLRRDGIPRELEHVPTFAMESSCGEEIQLDVEHVFGHDYRSGTYLVHWKNRGRAVLKRGPLSVTKKLAEAFELGIDWLQVDKELEIRHHLQRQGDLQQLQDVMLRIPQLLCSGKLKSPLEWQGCPAFVTSFHGFKTVDLVEGLPMDQVVDMGMSLVTSVSRLWRCGVRHRDISPRNIAYDEEGVGLDRFWLLDLGVAQCCGPRYGGQIARNEVVDLEFGSMNAALGMWLLEASSDFQSILFTMLVVSGIRLPWSTAAEAGDGDEVERARRRVLEGKDRLLPPGLPDLFRRLERLLHKEGEAEVKTFLRRLGLLEQ